MFIFFCPKYSNGIPKGKFAGLIEKDLTVSVSVFKKTQLLTQMFNDLWFYAALSTASSYLLKDFRSRNGWRFVV